MSCKGGAITDEVPVRKDGQGPLNDLDGLLSNGRTYRGEGRSVVVVGTPIWEQHIGDGNFAVGNTLTRADCTLVPALFLCETTVPVFGVDNPILASPKVAAYWAKIKTNEHAARVLEELARGLKARLDGTEHKMVKAAIAKAKAEQAAGAS